MYYENIKVAAFGSRRFMLLKINFFHFTPPQSLPPMAEQTLLIKEGDARYGAARTESPGAVSEYKN